MGGKFRLKKVTRLCDADWSEVALSNVRSHQKLDEAQKRIFLEPMEIATTLGYLFGTSGPKTVRL